MNKPQENYMTMFESVYGFLVENDALITNVPLLEDLKERLKEGISTIRTLDNQCTQVKTGKTRTKTQAKMDLITIILVVSRGLQAVGLKNQNMILQENARVSQSNLKQQRDTELLNTAQRIYNLAAIEQANLALFNVSATQVQTLLTLSETYRNAVQSKETSSAQKKLFIAQLNDAFKSTAALLSNEMDIIIATMETTQPNFVSMYHTLRSIKNLGKRYRNTGDVLAA